MRRLLKVWRWAQWPSPMLVAFLLVAFTGCTRYYWTKATATPEGFNQNPRECAERVGIPVSDKPGEVLIPLDAFRLCSRSRGWVRSSRMYDPYYEPWGHYRSIEDEGPYRLESLGDYSWGADERRD